MNHLGTIDLKTKRLLLRKFFVDDAEKSYYNWTSDEKVTVYLRWQKHKSIEETKQLFICAVKLAEYHIASPPSSP